MEFLAIITYLAVSALVVFFAEKLSTFVDLLDKKTNLSGAFLGAILLAMVTSLPELFTSLTSTIFVRENAYVLGNILGSNLFNMALFVVIYGFFFKKVIDAKVEKSHVFSLVVSGLMYVGVVIAAFVFDKNGWLLGWFNPLSIFVLALYVFSVIKTPTEKGDDKDEDEEEEKVTDSKLTVKQIVILFILFSLLLIGASIGMTYCVDWIVTLFPVIGKTFGGALFLGVATSLPELTATITLCRKGNYNAAIGDIVGSSVFNFLILVFGDIMSFLVKDGAGNWAGIYKINSSSMMLILCGVFSQIILIVTTTLICKKKLKNNNGGRALVLTTGILSAVSYIVFLVLSQVLVIA